MKTGKQTILTCPNKACGKVFAKPLTTLTLKPDSKEPYNACPYCLTEITTSENESKNPSEKAGTCKYHFGYISEREQNQQIPEECMLCAEIVECMHKKMTT